MASKSRRSRLAKDDKTASTDSPKNVKTARVAGTTNIAELNSEDELIEKVYEEPIDIVRKPKLDDDEIRLKLDSFDENIYSPKNNGVKENQNGRSRELRPTKLINFNEDILWDKEYSEKTGHNTVTRNIYKNASQAINDIANSSSRKRSKNNTDQKKDGVNGNETCQANQTSSPPKLPKYQTEIEQTLAKNSDLVDVKSQTSRSTVKRKLDLPQEPKNVNNGSRVRTRRSSVKKEINGKDWSSSDDNTSKKLEKEAKVCITKIPDKSFMRNNQQSSENAEVHESGESEIENNMSNANKNNFREKTRSASKLMQTPIKELGKTLYSPSKDLENLSININDAGTPKRGRLILKLKISDKDIPCTSNSNIEKQKDSRRKSQRIAQIPRNYRELDSNNESADSDDNYNVEEDTSDSEEQSQESGDDSAEEYQASRNKKKGTAKRITYNTVTKVSMNTPTKAIARMSLGTPSLDKHKRTNNISKPSTPLQKARATLHVSVLPKSLPCREEQFNDIYSFLHARLSDGSGGCIYISGVPGTGKTATVSEVIRCLKKSVVKGELDEFDYIDINGMKMSEPRQAYVQIWKQMTGATKTWEESHKLLQNQFTNANSKRNMTLLLVDELDLLCTKRQDVVYNLLDWPSKTNAKLVVVTIANTMDLPERILIGKVTSRLGLTRLTFPPYNFKQLEEIVVSRLKGANAFGGDTIQLVARKVAAVSGDARRALDICRRSAEIAEKNGHELVSMIDVKQALDEMIASPKIQAIKHCSDMEKYFLQAVCTEVQRTGVEEVVFKNVYMQMETLCTLDGIKTPNISEALEICARLGSWRLLLCDHSRMDIHQRLLLNVSADDVYFATKKIDA